MTRTRSTPARLPRTAARRRSGLVLQAARPVADRLAFEQGLVVWELEFSREAGRDTLRVAVDREGGVDAGAISRFADTLSRELDARDVVPGEGRYLLEVTSPGAERRLRTPEHFRICTGRRARVTFKDGLEPVVGAIADVGDEGMVLETDGGERRPIGYGEISQARLAVPGV